MRMFWQKNKPKPVDDRPVPQPNEMQIAAYYFQRYGNLVTDSIVFDGEKTPYELGNPYEFLLDYHSLRARAWEAYIKSDIVQNAIKKYCLWIVGSGLKFQLDPVDSILNKAGINIDYTQFSNEVEDRFRLFAESKNCSYNGMQNLHEIAVEALKNAILAGDVLCVIRFDGKNATIQLIDGYYVQQPVGVDYTGKRIVEGVELDEKGKHSAYYVYNSAGNYDRIAAYGEKTGRLQAWLMCGLKHKIEDTRGMSLFTAVLETASKMDRYKDATLKSAEENANIVMSIEHDSQSTGENPLANMVAQSAVKNKGVAQETTDLQCEAKATKVAQMTNGMAINMPNGAKLVRHSGSSDTNFGNFFNVNIDIVYATLGIPPEVAMDKFGGAYSGSRAALKSWEYKMTTDRKTTMTNQFYKPFYNFWFDIEVMRNNIQAPGYLGALVRNDIYTIEAYRKCRFIGVSVPHIDPVKEVNAERLKLGKKYEFVPFTDLESTCENLNTGDVSQLAKKVNKDMKLFKNITQKQNEEDNTNTDT